MTTFNYPTPNISSAFNLYVCLVNEGVNDAVIYYNGGLDIVTLTGSQTDCDNAVAACAPGTLDTVKSEKIQSVLAHSWNIQSESVLVTIAAGTAGFAIEDARTAIGYYESLAYAAAQSPGELPQMIPTVDGALSFTSAAEIQTLCDAIRHRLEYIYTNPAANGDGSKSELLLNVEILAQGSIAGVNAITDTRS